MSKYFDNPFVKSVLPATIVGFLFMISIVYFSSRGGRTDNNIEKASTTLSSTQTQEITPSPVLLTTYVISPTASPSPAIPTTLTPTQSNISGIGSPQLIYYNEIPSQTPPTPTVSQEVLLPTATPIATQIPTFTPEPSPTPTPTRYYGPPSAFNLYSDQFILFEYYKEWTVEQTINDPYMTEVKVYSPYGTILTISKKILCLVEISGTCPATSETPRVEIPCDLELESVEVSQNNLAYKYPTYYQTQEIQNINGYGSKFIEEDKCYYVGEFPYAGEKSNEGDLYQVTAILKNISEELSEFDELINKLEFY